MRLGCSSDLKVHVVNNAHSSANALKGFHGRADLLNAILGLSVITSDSTHDISSALLQSLNHQPDLFDRLLSSSGEISDFICDNGEATASISCSGCFNCGVQCQKVGLFGDGLNHV
ncbi:hypothetical protein D3C76_1538220 [compost metagenome]